MLLQNLNLKRIFNHYETTVNFTEGINLILGENSSGKTSIVESILFALYASTFKHKKITDIFYNFDINQKSTIYLKTSKFIIKRDIGSPKVDYLQSNNIKIEGREKINKYIEEHFVNKHFFTSIVYSAQDKLLDIVELSPSEKELFLNKALNIDYITFFIKTLTSKINQLKDKKSEIMFLMKKIEASKENRKIELLNQITQLEELLKSVEQDLQQLEKKKLLIEASKLLQDKTKWILTVIKLRKDIKEYFILQQQFDNNQNLLTKLKEKKSIIQTEIKNLSEKITKYQHLIQNNKCFYCERDLTKTDIIKYEKIITELQEKQLEFLTLLTDINSQIDKLTKTLNSLKSKLNKMNIYKLKGDLIKIKEKILTTPSRKFLKQITKNNNISETELEIITKLEKTKKYYDEIKDKISKFKYELNVILKNNIKKEYQILQEELTKINNLLEKFQLFKQIIEDYQLAGELRYSVLNAIQIEKIFDIFNLGKLSFNKEFEFFIDNIPLHLCSGSQKVASALAIKIAFLNLNKIDFLILDEPTMFLDKKRIEELKEMILLLYQKKLIRQLILITHEEAFKEIAHNLILVKKINGETKVI